MAISAYTCGLAILLLILATLVVVETIRYAQVRQSLRNP
jgi:hypothetical protein